MPPNEEHDISYARSTYLPLHKGEHRRVARTIDRGEAWVWLDYDEDGDVIGIEFLWSNPR